MATGNEWKRPVRFVPLCGSGAKWGVATFVLLFVALLPMHQAFAQSTTTGASAMVGNTSVTDFIERARVLQVVSQTIQNVPGTKTSETLQTLKAVIVSGPDMGNTVTVENDYLNLKPGAVFYVDHHVDPTSGQNSYTVQEPYRLPIIEVIVGLFVLVVVTFGGKQGVRGLLSLAASLAAIIYLLLPGILAGYSPVLLSVGISSFIIVVGSYITHGFSRTTTAAVLGMIAAICITGGLAYWSVHAAQFTGYTSDAVTYLHFSTNGGINLIGLLLGGIMIGVLGILYDAAIGQAVAVEELQSAGAHLSSWQIYRRATRIGREHIGALVNTLAIAYVGASLPLLLLLHFTDMPLGATINQEIFSSEIVRTAVGGIGLVLAIPFTTVIAIWLLAKKGADDASRTSERAHSHSHHH